MNKILLASHGYLAQGMKSSLEILMGTDDRIECLCAYVDDDSRDVAALIDAWMEAKDPADSWFVVTDIFGGSVSNEFIQRQVDGSFTLITGMNLPLLVEMVTQLDSLWMRARPKPRSRDRVRLFSFARRRTCLPAPKKKSSS